MTRKITNRWRTAALLAVGLGAGLLPRPSAATPRKVVAISVDGTVVFTASETARTRIRFEHPIDWADVRHVHVKGQGRLYGFIMRKTGEYEQEADRPYMKWIASAACDTRACVTDPKEHPGAAGVFYRPVKKLSGVWDVYVIADGAPVRVDFVVAGSRARDEISVAGHVTSEIVTFTPTVHDDAGNLVYSGGGFTTLEDTDSAQIMTWVMGTPYVASTAGVCGYEDESQAPAGGAFVPQCPGGPEVLSRPMFDASTGERRQPVYSASYPYGYRGIGTWHVAAGHIEEFAAVGMWIDFPEI